MALSSLVWHVFTSFLSRMCKAPGSFDEDVAKVAVRMSRRQMAPQCITLKPQSINQTILGEQPLLTVV